MAATKLGTFNKSKNSFNPHQKAMFQTSHKAYNQDGDNENTLAEKIIFYLNTKGYTAWKQENRGVFDLNRAARNVALVVEKLQRGNLTNAEIHQTIFTILSKSFNNLEKLGKKGVADVIGFHRKSGKWVAVEIKINNDELRPEQKDFINSINDASGIAFVARTFEQFKTSFENHSKISELS
jgi:ribosomal protein S20